jgi:hypothetical protein
MSTSIRRTVASIVLVFVVSLWIFVVFFFDGILGNIARQKLIDAVRQGTHGEYQLSFVRFSYHRGKVFATGMDLSRVGYRPSERGTTLRRLAVDSIRVTGIRWVDALFGRPLSLSSLQTYNPNVYLCDAAQERARSNLILPDTVEASSGSSQDMSISVKSVSIPDVAIFKRDEGRDSAAGALSFACQGLTYDSKSPAPLHLTSKRFDLHVPWIDYADSSGHYMVTGVHASNADSVLTVDTFAFATYTANPIALCGSGIRGDGIDYIHSISGKGIAMRSLESKTWAVSFAQKAFSDSSRPPAMAQQANLSWQDKLARSVSFPITIGRLRLQSGTLDFQSAPNERLAARGLSVGAVEFDFDTGTAAVRPCFSQQFEITADSAMYKSRASFIGVKSLTGNLQDSLVTAQRVAYGSKPHSGNAAMQFQDVRADGIDFPKLLSGSAISLNNLDARGWSISELPTSPKSKKASVSASSKKESVWNFQRDFAKSVAIPIIVNRIDLSNGRMHVMGASSPTIIADRARVEVVGFDLDSTTANSRLLFFSKDIHLGASTFHYADQSGLDAVDFEHMQSSLHPGSFSANSAVYLTRSSFEPDFNHTSFQCNDLHLAGIDFASLFDNKRASVQTAKAQSWLIEGTSDTVSDVSSHTGGSSNVSSNSWKLPVIIGHAAFPNGEVQFRERDTVGFSPTLRTKVTSLDISDFSLLPVAKAHPSLAFGQVECVVPTLSYAPLFGFYSFEIRNLKGNLRDSLVTMDSLGYIPKYSEDVFASLHKYARGRTDFRLAPVRVSGIDARRIIDGKGITVQAFDASSLWLDYYKDEREPADPNPTPAVMPNDIVRSLHFPLTINTVQFEDGHIQIREHTLDNFDPGNLTFEHVKITATPLCFDSANPEIAKPTRFGMSGTFVGQSEDTVTMIYPLHDSALNLSAVGAVGPFDLKQLNAYLVNAERKEITKGQVHHADIEIKIHDGVGTTTVLPIYDHFKLKVLPPDPHDPPDIQEKAETFIANTFILRDDNPDENGGPPVSATTTLVRQQPQEFFQFLWLAIRHSLGTVVGGFK